ncbi:MAG: hypothetical protein IJY48_07790, partial [Mailhella sp.]|nr:hypothetical protein [Mailhella sp.]
IRSAEAVNWSLLEAVAEQMHDIALCGVGRTGTQPLLDALRHFPDALRPQPDAHEGGFYSVTTSPCIEACPAHVNVPRYIDYLQDGHNDLAAGVVLKHYPHCRFLRPRMRALLRIGLPPCPGGCPCRHQESQAFCRRHDHSSRHPAS